MPVRALSITSAPRSIGGIAPCPRGPSLIGNCVPRAGAPAAGAGRGHEARPAIVLGSSAPGRCLECNERPAVHQLDARHARPHPPPPPPPPPRTKWTRRVPHPVLIGHTASLGRWAENANLLDARQARGHQTAP